MSAKVQLLAMSADVALAKLEDRLIGKARDLCRLGFTPQNLSPSQMMAVGECLRGSGTLNEAKQRTTDFLQKQMEKLTTKAERTGKPPTSWAISVTVGGAKETLGAMLMQWITGEKYLSDPAKPPADLDHLEALQRFWSRLHGLYRYEVEVRESMPLQSPKKEA